MANPMSESAEPNDPAIRRSRAESGLANTNVVEHLGGRGGGPNAAFGEVAGNTRCDIRRQRVVARRGDVIAVTPAKRRRHGATL